MGEKQKGRGTNVPSADQLRLSKLSLDPSDDTNLQKLIKKVIETTRCSVAQAEVALLDNENDVHGAILHILDRNGQVDCWTEQKSRKTKKEDAEKEAETRRFVVEASTSRRGGRGASAPRPIRGTAYPPRGTSMPRGGGGPMSSRGGGGAFGRGGGRGGRVSQPNQTTSTEAAADNNVTDEVDWKKGPLTFESTSSATTAAGAAAASPPAATPAAPVNMPTAAGPMSFAAMAKKATTPAPPPPPAPVYVPPPPPPAEPEPLPEIEPEEPEIEEEIVADESLETALPEPTPEEPTPEPTVEDLEESVERAQTWTTQLKTNLGIGMEEEKRTLRQRVEFVDTAGSAPLSEYQFGFCAPDPQPVIAASVPAVPSPPEPTLTRTLPTQHVPQPPLQEEPMKTSPPSFSRGLSYETTSSMAYPPSENRSMMPPRTQPAPQPQPVQTQQQTAHSSMFPHQMAAQYSYAANPYMNIYSPVGGMRADDPYGMMQYQFPGLGQIDLSNILPQGLSSQNTAPPSRTEHTEMNKYGGVARQNESVAPPPGFASNPNQFMAQQSLSSLLVQPQPQYNNHPFTSFMMQQQSVGNNRYEEERRAKESRSSHQSHNTPPPHMGHYSQHHQQSNTGAYGSLHKKSQYPSNNWNN